MCIRNIASIFQFKQSSELLIKYLIILHYQSDIKESALAVLRHRIIVSPEREMEGLTADEIIRQILESIEVPR